MKNKKIILILICVLIAASMPAQTYQSSFIRHSEFNVGASYQTWSTEDSDQASEFVLPVVYLLPVNNQLSFSLLNAPTSASRKNVDKSLSGLTDTRIGASYITMNEQLLLTGGVSLPTGNARLDADQMAVSSALAVNALDFRVPTLGQGLDIKLSAAYAVDMEAFVLGIGVGYLKKGSFKPFKNDEMEYAPGDELTLTVGGDKDAEFAGTPVKLIGDLTYTRYGNDEIDGKEIFKSGNKLLIDLRSLWKMESMNLLVYLRDRTKGKNQRGLGSLSTESLNSNGNQLEFGGISYLPLNSTLNLKGILETKFYSKNAYKTGGATIFGIGAGLQKRVSNRFMIDGQAKFLKGSLKDGDSSNGLTGIEIGTSILYQL